MDKIYNLIFMGTPDFAVPSLKALDKSRHKITLVITQPDRPKGRGRKIIPTPVKSAALELGYDVLQPESLDDKDFFKNLQYVTPDFFIVVAFGHILNKEMLALPGTGSINLHASLLPKYRGSAPIQRALINGETETGVTTMLLNEGMDTGDILLSKIIKIARDDTSASLHDKLSLLGADLILETLDSYSKNSISCKAQDDFCCTYAPMLKKSDGRIDWKKSAMDICCLIRGVTPWPGAFTFHNEIRLKILASEPIAEEIKISPGTVTDSFPGELQISTGQGILSILEIQGPSGKKLLIKDFLRGYKIQPGDIFE